MSVLARITDFSPGTVMRSSEVDAEFDQLVNLLNGADLINSLFLGGVDVSVPATPPKLFVKGQAEFANPNSGRVVSVWKTGEANPRIDLFNTGQIRTVASQQPTTPSTQLMVLGGTLYANSQNIGNVGAGEDTLHAPQIGSQVLASNKSYLTIKARGTAGANANNKRLRFYLDPAVGADILILDTGVQNHNGTPWFFEAEVINDSDNPTQVTVAARFIWNTTDARTVQNVTFDTAADNNFKWTAEAVSDNDLVCSMVIIEKGYSVN